MWEHQFAQLQVEAGLSDAQVEMLRGATEVFGTINQGHHPMGALAEAMRVADRVAAIFDGQRALLTARFAAGTDWAWGGARTAAVWMGVHTGMSQSHAGHLIKQARQLQECPVVSVAFADGRLTADKVRLLLGVRDPRLLVAFAAEEAALVARVAALTVADADRDLRDWKEAAIDRSGINDPDNFDEHIDKNTFRLSPILDGRNVVSGELDAANSATLQSAIDAVIKLWHADGRLVGDARSLGQLQADALIELAKHGLGFHAPARAAVQVIIDHDTLVKRAGAHDGDLMPFRSDIAGHGPVSPDALRRLCCNADISRVIMRGPSEILDVGRQHRLATPAIRRAVWARSRGVCEGCRQTRLTWCQIHHINPWETGGATSLQNSMLVCNHCHRLIHEGKHRVERTERGFLLRKPDGTPIQQRPPPPTAEAA